MALGFSSLHSSSTLSLLACCCFPSPLLSAPLLSHSSPRGMAFRSTPAAHRRAENVCPNNSCLVRYGWEHPGKQAGTDLRESQELYKEIILLFSWYLGSMTFLRSDHTPARSRVEKWGEKMLDTNSGWIQQRISLDQNAKVLKNFCSRPVITRCFK